MMWHTSAFPGTMPNKCWAIRILWPNGKTSIHPIDDIQYKKLNKIHNIDYYDENLKKWVKPDWTVLTNMHKNGNMLEIEGLFSHQRISINISHALEIGFIRANIGPNVNEIELPPATIDPNNPMNDSEAYDNPTN